MSEAMQPYCPPEAKQHLQGGDIFFAQFPVKDAIACECVLTSRAIFLCDVAKTAKWTKPWLETYSVNSINEKKLSLSFVDPKKNIKMPIDTRTLEFETRTQRDLWVIVFRRLFRDAQQEYFENRWIPAPDIYQMHRLCLKYTPKGKRVQIVAAVSARNLLLFSIPAKNSIAAKELIGSCPLTEVTSIISHSNCDTLVTVTGSSSLLGGVGKTSSDLILRFYTPEDASWFMKELSRVFFIQSKAAPKKFIRKLSRTDSVSKGIKGGFIDAN